MNNAIDILDKALNDLESMSYDELIDRNKMAGIIIPKEAGLLNYLQFFNSDLKGIISESPLLFQNHWIPQYLIDERRNITIPNNNKKSHSKVALSFYQKF